MEDHRAEQKGDVSGRRGVTLRSVVIGLMFGLGLNTWAIYAAYIAPSSWRVVPSSLNDAFFPEALFLFVLLLAGVVNPALRRLRPKRVLSRTEILVVLSMGLVGGVPTATLFGIVAIPYYLATPENRWDRYLHPYLPDWLVPPDANLAVTSLFKGLPEGYSGPWPWRAWTVPLLWWMLLLGVVAFICACISVTLRRQWTENERLTYPVLAPALDLTVDSDTARMWPGLMRDPLFWVGAVPAFVLLSWNAVAHLSPAFPTISFGNRYYYFGRDFPPVYYFLDPYVIGFSYFANLDILFSIWFFFLAFVVEFGLFNHLGYSIGGRGDRGGSYDAASEWQSFGAFCVFVLWELWIARRHLKVVFSRLFHSGRTPDESREMLSYRTAAWGIVLGLPFIVFWLHRSGMDYKLTVPLVIAAFVLYTGVARIIAESGLLYVMGPLTAQTFSIYLVGANSVSARALTSLSLSYVISPTPPFGAPHPYIDSPLSALAHIAKIGEFIRRDRRRLFLAVALSYVTMSIFAVSLTLYWGYSKGADNFGHPFVHSGVHLYPDTISKIKKPFGADWSRIAFFGVGAVVMAAMTLARYRLPGWPLHPIGFTISGTDLVRNNVALIFIAWAVKSLILKTGGIVLYRRFRTLFIGLLAGHVIGSLASILIGLLQ